jgi:hypothetical protein
MHPTADGHAVYSRCLKTAVARHLFPKGPLVPTTPNVPDDDVVVAAAET